MAQHLSEFAFRPLTKFAQTLFQTRHRRSRERSHRSRTLEPMRDLSDRHCPECEVEHLHADLIFSVDRAQKHSSFEATDEAGDGTITFRYRRPTVDDAQLVLTCCACDYEESRSVRFVTA